MLPRKVTKNLHAVMAIFVYLEQFLWQVLFKRFAPNSESSPSPNMMHFGRTFSICTLLKA